MLPLFLLRREKYTAGFRQRLGNYPKFEHDGRAVVWLHCVSVGETNAARPLVDSLLYSFPDHRVIFSTTTKTGQDLAKKIFADRAEAIFYFPFDWKFSVRRALAHYNPSVVLLMETEIWPRFVREAAKGGSKIAIINGRLSPKSFGRYSKVRRFLSRILGDIDLALMQGESDAGRIVSLGMTAAKTRVTGNIKFDLEAAAADADVTEYLAGRFKIDGRRPLIIAASTHEPEEEWVLDAYCSLAAGEPSPLPRLLIAPRHPERFDSVAKMISKFRSDPRCEWTRYSIARRSDEAQVQDVDADIILLDSIGELRSVYPLADIVFVGGSLIPHGGQSVLEPAAAEKAIITGPYVHNFEEVVRIFQTRGAIISIRDTERAKIVDALFLAFADLIENVEQRRDLGRMARAIMSENRGATEKTVELLKQEFS